MGGLMKKFITVLSVMLTLTGVIYAQSADEVITNVQKQVQVEMPVRVKFQQVFEWKLTGKVDKSEGSMVLKGYDQFRIETQDQTVVSNGKTMWTYSNLENQVIVDTVRNTGRALMPRDILFSYPEEYDTNILRKQEDLGGKSTVVLRMTPKDEDQYLQEIKVWVNRESWKPVQVEFTDLNENTTLYKIDSIKPDASVNDSTFVFQPPDGTEIIDVR